MSMPILNRYAPAVDPRFAPVTAPQPGDPGRGAPILPPDTLVLSSSVSAGGGTGLQDLFDKLHALVNQSSAPAPAPSVPQTGSGSGPLLGVGNAGASVKALQERLRDLGFDPGPIDGNFGPLTQMAVKEFQRHHDLDPDGVVGPKTWAQLGIHVVPDEQQPLAPGSKPPAGSFKEAADPANLVTYQGFQMLKGTAEALQAMQAAAKADGVNLTVTSAFRSDAYQAQLFKKAVAKYGSESAARKWVAPPGKSQHRSGRALDIKLEKGVHAWLSKNAAKFGFYQPMSWEDWHWTFTGKARGSQG